MRSKRPQLENPANVAHWQRAVGPKDQKDRNRQEGGLAGALPSAGGGMSATALPTVPALAERSESRGMSGETIPPGHIARDKFHAASKCSSGPNHTCNSSGRPAELLYSFGGESWSSRHASAGHRCLRTIHTIVSCVEPLSVVHERWPIDQNIPQGEKASFTHL